MKFETLKNLNDKKLKLLSIHYFNHIHCLYHKQYTIKNSTIFESISQMLSSKLLCMIHTSFKFLPHRQMEDSVNFNFPNVLRKSYQKHSPVIKHRWIIHLPQMNHLCV